MMLAAVVKTLGGPPQPLTHPIPQPPPGQALIQVAAAALNPIDVLISSGRHPSGVPSVPHVPGVEGVGQVVRGGTLVPGTRVRFTVLGGFVDGALAQYVSVAEHDCVPIPDDLDDSVAAAAGVVGTCALVALRDRAGLRAGERVLVLGGTGAFGRMFIQLAKVLGADRVVAAGRRADRLDGLLDLGADSVFTLPAPGSDGPEWLAKAAGERFDVVVDPLWGPYALAGLACLEPGGRLLNVGSAAAPNAEIGGNFLRHSAASMVGFTGTSLAPDVAAQAYQEVAGYLIDGRVAIDTTTYALHEVAEAWRLQVVSPGRKVVLIPPRTAP
jgi:NADPH2:quinone reductase